MPPNCSTYWQLKTRRLEFPARPLVMGILNVTPDSFSDGGEFASTSDAIERGLQMAMEGADLIDVGGESTRPYSEPVDEAEELRRVLPIVQALAEQTSVPISIDTSKAAVARECLAAGAEIINDVTALTGDERMIETALDTQAAVCAMHMLGTPQTMQDNPTYGDVVTEVLDYLRRRRDAQTQAGIAQDKIALDPGIGFGKTHEHNLTLVAHCRRFHELGCPLLVGHSRKGFIGKIIGDKLADRTAGGIGVSLSLANQGVQILRVHDVAPTLHALILYLATGGLDV
jgi:dihydropteroate synthase